jgi:hypothetical protein
MKKKMQKKCRFENKLVKPENWTGQEFTFSPTVPRGAGYSTLSLSLTLSNSTQDLPSRGSEMDSFLLLAPML